MNQFDEIAYRSAGSARASVSQLAVPPSPYRSASRRSVKTGLVITAATAVIIGLIVATNGGSSPVDVAGSPTGASVGNIDKAPGPFFEFDVPDGWVLGVSPTRHHPSGTTLIGAGLAYGAGPPDHPFDDSDLSISISSTSPDSYPPPGPRQEVVIRGHLGEIGVGGGGFEMITWQENDKLALSMSSKRYSVEAMTRIAESLIVDGFSVTLPAPPDGMSLVTSRGIPEPESSQNFDTWNMDIADPNSEARVILRGLEPQIGLLDYMRFTRTDLVDVDVRGTLGVLDSTQFDNGAPQAGSVYWVEDGQAMWLLVIGPGDPVSIANSLQRIDRARFDRLLADNPGPVNSPTTTSPTPSAPPPAGTTP